MMMNHNAWNRAELVRSAGVAAVRRMPVQERSADTVEQILAAASALLGGMAARRDHDQPDRPGSGHLGRRVVPLLPG